MATVQEILDQILRLPAEERQRLDELLAQQEEREWREESDRARRKAQERGLDQEAIDRAVRAGRRNE
jgi:DNA repair photolyase